ncbi:MAG: roadblock/LC7 domain-containing protein [Thermoplasmata archaeon]
MPEYLAIDKILDEVRSIPSVYEATVVSRSGMHIAGESPRGVHLETYVAMSAILLGAAETATAEMKDKLQHVSVELSRGKMVLTSAGNRALLVVTASNEAQTAELAQMMRALGERIAQNL